MLFSLTNPEVAIMMMGIFLFAVLLGFPIAFTLMAMGLGFGYYAYFDPTKMEHLFDNRIFQLFVQNTYTVMDNNVLTAVPLFLFMGYLVERAGIVAKLFFAIRLASHRLPASMAVAALIIFLTEVTSNVATTSTFLPVFGAVAVAVGVAPEVLTVPVVLAASCAFMLPVATPPNAIVYGANKFKIIDMMRAGFFINIAGVFVVTVFAYYFAKVIF